MSLTTTVPKPVPVPSVGAVRTCSIQKIRKPKELIPIPDMNEITITFLLGKIFIATQTFLVRGNHIHFFIIFELIMFCKYDMKSTSSK